ncbi:hypothetical protein OG900_33600 [Streptomyces sp. NBC_00433]
MQINHRAEAEKHLATAAHHNNENPPDMRIAEVSAWIGQGYAALARNEEQAASHADMRDALTLLRQREYAVRELVSTHIAQGLASRDTNRWKAAVDLAKALDEGDANMDDLIDARLTDDGWDARSAWKTPASATPADDPWAPTPDISADIPAPVRRVIAGQLASMLLNGDNVSPQQWARNFATALKNEGADLDDAIKTRIHELTLGYSDEPPF